MSGETKAMVAFGVIATLMVGLCLLNPKPEEKAEPYDAGPNPGPYGVEEAQTQTFDPESGDWIIDYDPAFDPDPVKPEKPIIERGVWMLGGIDASDTTHAIRTDSEGRCIASPESGLRIIVCHDDGECQEVKP